MFFNPSCLQKVLILLVRQQKGMSAHNVDQLSID